MRQSIHRKSQPGNTSTYKFRVVSMADTATSRTTSVVTNDLREFHMNVLVLAFALLFLFLPVRISGFGDRPTTLTSKSTKKWRFANQRLCHRRSKTFSQRFGRQIGMGGFGFGFGPQSSRSICALLV